MRPFFCFYGGKWRAAPRYPVPSFGTIVEPFAGAAGYSTRYPEARVILVERDPVIAGIWSYLRSVSAAEVRRIPLLGPGETIDDLDGVPEEARSLVGFWLNKGSASPKRSPSAWMRSGIRPRSFWGSDIRDRIASQVEKIRHWSISEGAYETATDVSATWFIDPPYSGPAGRRYRFGAVDYPALGAWCRKRRGQVIVCEGDGASWLPFRPFICAKANEHRNGGHVSRESIWLQTDGVEIEFRSGAA